MHRSICTNCSYIYNPFTEDGYAPLDSLDPSWTCPHCEGSVDYFMEIPEVIQEPSRAGQSTEQELSHLPRYRRADGAITITVGSPDDPHPTEDGHFIEYIGIFDTDGDIIDIHIRPTEATVTFPDDDLDAFDILVRCNLHGTWRGIEIA